MKPERFWEKTSIGRTRLFVWATVILSLIFVFASMAFLQFICLFFIFILCSSRFYTAYLARNLRVIRQDTEIRVFKNEWVRMEIKIENRGLLPAYMLVAGDSPGRLHFFNMNKAYCNLLRKSWTLHYWEGYCAERGVFTIGPAVLRGADPLGLFPFQLTAGETSTLYVYPSLRSISLKNTRGIPLGNIISNNPLFEDITRYRSLRPYHRGDEPRRINWKASAHAGDGQQSGLLVNEFEATASYPLMVFLNLNQYEYPQRYRKAYMERAIEAAASLCLKASRERQIIGIIIYISQGSSDEDDSEEISIIAPSAFTLVPVLERLAAVDWKPVTEEKKKENEKSHNYCMMLMLEQGKRLPYGTRYVYAGPDLGDEAYRGLNSLKRNHIFPEYIIISERTVPPFVPGNSPRYQMKESGNEII